MTLPRMTSQKPGYFGMMSGEWEVKKWRKNTSLCWSFGREEKKGGRESSAGTVWSAVDTEDLHMFVFDLRAAARKGAGEDTEREKFTEEVSRGGDRVWGQEHTWED